MGCRAIIGSTYHCAQETGGLVKAASGAFERLPYYSVTNISNIIETLREHGFLIIGLDHSGNVSIADLLKNLKTTNSMYFRFRRKRNEISNKTKM